MILVLEVRLETDTQLSLKLRCLKRRFKQQIQTCPGIAFRKINDPAGECGTLLTVYLPTKEVAQKVARSLDTTTVSQSGWHVYSNMEQILEKRMITPHGCPYRCHDYPCRQEYHKGMLPKTDQLLERAINLSVGVVDRGLGAAFGVHPFSTDEEVDRKAEEFITAVKASL